MKNGLMLAADHLPGAALAGCAARAEEIGLDALWVPEIFGREPFVTAGALLQATRTIDVGTAIANVYVRDPMSTKAAAATLNDIYGGRFNLGLGVSNTVGNTLRGHQWLPPVEKLDQYLTAMQDWRLAFAVDAQAPVYLAAHGPKLIRFAAERADGAFMYLSTGPFIREAKALLGEGKELIIMQPCAVSDSIDEARKMASRTVGIYTDLANYQRAWKAQGFAESDYANGPSNHLLDSLVALGSIDDVRARLAERREDGATQIIIIPLNRGANGEPDWEVVASLAAA